MSIKPTLVVVVGATGSGKTDLSIALAKHLEAPIISADSRQIFRNMAIGTAQPTAEQLRAVKHHFIATHNPTEHYTAGAYEHDALALLDELFVSHKTVIAVGGSGLYIDALCNGMDSLPQCDQQLRAALAERLSTSGLDNLLEELCVLDPQHYQEMDRANPKRVMRALEVCLQTGKPYSEQRSGSRAIRRFNIVKIGTQMAREELYDRINRRVDMMITDGLEPEARALYPLRECNALQTVGYRELFSYFDNAITLDEAIELIKRNSRHYAKRQITWFGKDQSIEWFNPKDIETIVTHLQSVFCK